MLAKLTSRLSPRSKAWVSLGIWCIIAVIFAIGLVSWVARSYTVHGISMEPTVHSGDVILINKVGPTIANITGKPFVPARNSLVVFANPFYNQGEPDMFIVKRVIGLPSDRVVVRDGRVTVYAASSPSTGFNPDDGVTGPQSPTSGNVDRTVPDGELFVAGDNRVGKNSLDSRNGMSTVPLGDVQGVVVWRFWPLNQLILY
jgi:signal peptidase I